MSEERVGYLLKDNEKRDRVETHARIVRVTDPLTDRFVFEYDTERDEVIWRDRGRRIVIELSLYRKSSRD
jgi:hypothetical protein